MNFLAFDTSTRILSVAISRDGSVWTHSDASGAQASANLIPVILQLLQQAGLHFGALNAIAFGHGPGAFTGLRTACAAAQGMGFAASVPLLPINTLLATAEDARHRHGCTDVCAVLDARMDEVYCASWSWRDGLWHATAEQRVGPPEQVRPVPGQVLAGNAFEVFGPRLPQDVPRLPASPCAEAMLRLAPALLAAGCAVEASQGLPLYVRDKVAQTTAERMALKQKNTPSATGPA